MGREQREKERARIEVLESVRGHDSTVPHAFNHTGGQCPKCGNGQQVVMFCAPDVPRMNHVRGCELDGEHLHRICGACRYPWIERCLDQAMLSEQSGVIAVESEIAAALAVILERAEGAELDQQLVSSRRGWRIQFTRNPEKRTLVLTATPATESSGKAVHPESEDDYVGAPA